MKTAIIADIHSNYQALTAVLEQIEKEKVDKIVCLGDSVGYGADPDKCLDLLMDNQNITSILGNHEYGVLGMLDLSGFNSPAKKSVIYSKERLKKHHLKYLEKLGLKHFQEEMEFSHACFYFPDSWAYPKFKDIKNQFDYMGSFVGFIGHTHIPSIYSINGDKKITVFYSTSDVVLEKEYRYIVNTGSVGQPRDNDNRACFGIFNSSTLEFRHIRVEYDWQLASKRILEEGLPEFLADRLGRGE